MRACPLRRSAPHRYADGEVRRIGAQHHEPSRQPIGDHATDEQRGDLRERPAGKGIADVRRRAGEVEDREGDGDRREVRPKEGDRARADEQAEVALAECASEIHPSDCRRFSQYRFSPA
jgi:hypothetical protein